VDRRGGSTRRQLLNLNMHLAATSLRSQHSNKAWTPYGSTHRSGWTSC
jgi:hypothetical protein